MRTSAKLNTIEELTTTVYDTGRRGNPKMGCDCVQCFGYCISDRDQLQRDASRMSGGSRANASVANDASGKGRMALNPAADWGFEDESFGT